MSEFTRDQIEKFVSKGYESVSARYVKSAFEIIKDLEAERAKTEDNFTVITDEAYEHIEELKIGVETYLKTIETMANKIIKLEETLQVAIDIGAAFYCQIEYKNKLQEKMAELMYKKLKALEK